MNEVALSSGFVFPSYRISFLQRTRRFTCFSALVTSVFYVKCSHKQGGQVKANSRADENSDCGACEICTEYVLYIFRRPGGMVSEFPNEKEAVYGELDKWTAWEMEFPMILVAKALRILRQRRQWLHVIQVEKWMLSKGQGATMGTYDILLLAFDMDKRIDEADSLWHMILHMHTHSISKRLFSRMISLYGHHNMQDEIIEVFADTEELGVRPDEDTVRRVACALKKLGQEEKQELVLKRYLSRWKYTHFNGERVRVRRDRSWLE